MQFCVINRLYIINMKKENEVTMKPTMWNAGISAKHEGKGKMTGSYSKSTPPREAAKESLLRCVGSTEPTGLSKSKYKGLVTHLVRLLLWRVKAPDS